MNAYKIISVLLNERKIDPARLAKSAKLATKYAKHTWTKASASQAGRRMARGARHSALLKKAARGAKEKAQWKKIGKGAAVVGGAAAATLGVHHHKLKKAKKDQDDETQHI